MQIQKRYKGINPELVYEELRDILQRHRAVIDQQKSFKEQPAGGGLRGTLVAKFPVEVERSGLLGTRKELEEREAISARILGMTEGVTSLLIRIDESVVARGNISEMMSDLDFVGKPYETSAE